MIIGIQLDKLGNRLMFYRMVPHIYLEIDFSQKLKDNLVEKELPLQEMMQKKILGLTPDSPHVQKFGQSHTWKS